MAGESVRAVAKLWEAHGQAAFPGGLRGADVAGVDMVMLDADIAGCVQTWLDTGDLDDRRWRILAAREQDLGRVIPRLTGYEASYYQRLRDMTTLVLDQAQSSSRVAELSRLWDE